MVPVSSACVFMPHSADEGSIQQCSGRQERCTQGAARLQIFHVLLSFIFLEQLQSRGQITCSRSRGRGVSAGQGGRPAGGSHPVVCVSLMKTGQERDSVSSAGQRGAVWLLRHPAAGGHNCHGTRPSQGRALLYQQEVSLAQVYI